MLPNSQDERPAIAPRAVLLALIALLYIALIGRYNAYDIDSRWFPSFSHAFIIEHIETDSFMRGHFPDGMGGVIAFGKLAAIVQGLILNVAGWSLAAATSVSIVFILAALVLLARFCHNLGYSANFTFCYIALMGFTEPFVAAAERARYEFLPVFQLCLALYLASRNRIILAMFIAAVASEIEPAAMVIIIGITTFICISNSRQPKPLPMPRLFAYLLLGPAAALGVYLLLHQDILSVFRAANWASVDQGHFPGGFVAAYFFVYKRHLPELAVVLAAIIACNRGNRKHLFRDWPALCSAAILIGAVLLRWPNIAYFAFLAPFLLFFVLQAFYTENRRYWIVAAVLLFTLTQYVHRYKLWTPSNPGFSQPDERQADDAITRAAAVVGKPADQLNLLGDYALWFAHPHLFTNLNKKIINPNASPPADLILCLDHPFNPLPASTQELLCTDLNPTTYQETEELTLNTRKVHLLIPKR